MAGASPILQKPLAIAMRRWFKCQTAGRRFQSTSLEALTFTRTMAWLDVM
jgi:hypothetical protein